MAKKARRDPDSVCREILSWTPEEQEAFWLAARRTGLWKRSSLRQLIITGSAKIFDAAARGDPPPIDPQGSELFQELVARAQQFAAVKQRAAPFTWKDRGANPDFDDYLLAERALNKTFGQILQNVLDQHPEWTKDVKQPTEKWLQNRHARAKKRALKST